MERNSSKYFKYKIIIIILYLIFCLVSLPLIFIFPPRKFLITNDSLENENRKYLFENFVSEIVDNINKPLIDDITLTKDDEECPDDYEILKVEHQHYGNFTRFFKNSSFCIKRNENKEWNFKSLLEKNDSIKCESNKKSCGIVNQISQSLLCINENEACPLNGIYYDNKKGSHFFEISHSGVYFNPKYDENSNKSQLLIGMDLVYKSKVCLEKYQRFELLECEFVDNDECSVTDGVTSNYISFKTIEQNIHLLPINLIKLNIDDNEKLAHDYCEGAKREEKFFETFAKSFVNFNKNDLDNFLEEFNKSVDKDPLSQIVETYELGNNFETLFYYFSIILFIWSTLQLVILILLFFLNYENILKLLKKIFIYNGLILFFVKLICFLILLSNHYVFYLKFKAVYLKLEDDPRNEILNKYKNLRTIFITKIFIIWIVGFILITIELIILFFVNTIATIFIEQIFQALEINNKEKENIVIEKPILEKMRDESTNRKIKDIENKSIDNKNNKTNNSYILNNSNTIDFLNKSDQNSHKSKIIGENPYIQINLTFIIIANENNRMKDYNLKVELNDNFVNIEEKLKKKYPELEDAEMKIFRNDSKIINKQKSVKENNIKNNEVIKVDC